MRSFGLLLLLLAASLLVGCRVHLAEDHAQRGARAAAVPDTGYAVGPASRGGTGRYYFGREIAQVMGHEGAAWLERPERERVGMPDAVVDALDLEPEYHVADIGAGTGFFTTRLARAVSDGWVYAVDVQEEMLDMLEDRLDRQGITNVVTVLGLPHDPQLEPESVNLVLIVDAYHEFYYPREMLANVREALVPGGRLVMIEYRAEDNAIPIHPLHRMSEAQARREVEASGFRWVETRDFLPQQHFMVFER